MSTFLKATAAGAAGAAVTNVVHEITRRIAPDAPRVDLLGMQSLNGILKRLGGTPLEGDDLYRATLAGDLASNSLYFSAVNLLPRSARITGGLALGLLAGIGAVVLPGPLGLRKKYTARTPATQALTILFYTAGGLTAGAIATAFSTDDTSGASASSAESAADDAQSASATDELAHAGEPNGAQNSVPSSASAT